MSDPPPKKVSSLRDRIAAFENKGSAPAPTAPPAPRPKPGHINWAPKPLSPPTSPKAASSANDEGAEARKASGMSATDAKEYIGKLSLKERMAALQGSGGFSGAGGVAATPPPRPSGEKPKWKPPPVVQRVEAIRGDDEEDKPAEVKPAAESEHAEEPKSSEEVAETKESEQEAKEEGEPDPQEEERQRRAALAARMARLGGARIGMSPPIFGKKPDIPPKKVYKEEEEPKEEQQPNEKPIEVSPTAESPEVPAVVELIGESAPASTAEGGSTDPADYFDATKKDYETSATLSPDSAVMPPPVRSPAMPVPQVPRRAAPPRKRAAKSPSPAPPVIGQEIHESPAALPSVEETVASTEQEDTSDASEGPHGDRKPELTEGQTKKLEETIPMSEPIHEHETTESAADTETHSAAEEEHATQSPLEEVSGHPKEHVAEEQKETAAIKELKHEDAPSAEEVETPVVEDLRHEEVPADVDTLAEAPVEEPEEEEDEAARRKRIADRIAKSGGFNPFSGGMSPPVRKNSTGSVRSPISPPSQPLLPICRDSHQETTALQSPPLLPTSPNPQVPARKDSVGSVRAGTGLGSPTEEASLDDRRTESDDDDAIAEEDEEEDVRGRSLERSAPANEDNLEDEEAGARAEHEATHTLANEESDGEYGEAHDGADDYRIARERQEVPELTAGGYGVREAPHPLHVPRPPPTLPPTQTVDEAEEQGVPTPSVASPPPPPVRQFIPPPPKRVSLPPPPPRVVPPPPTAPSEEDIDEDERVTSPDVSDEEYAKHAREIGLEHEVDEHEHQLHDDEYEDNGSSYQNEHERGRSEEHPTNDKDEEPEVESAPPPPPRRVPVPAPPLPIQDDEDEQEADEDDFDAPAPPPPPRRASVQVPPPPTHALLHGEDKEEDVSEYEEPGEEDEAPAPPPPPPRNARPTSPSVSAAALSRPVPPPIRAPSPVIDEEGEVLDDSDVDPIDPEFYSPKSPGLDSRAGFPLPLQSPSAGVISPPPPPPPRVVSPLLPPPFQRVVSPQPPSARVASPVATSPSSQPEHPEAGAEEDGENPELARRRTIAERMAKLGGIRFGAPPPVPAARRPPPPPEPEHEDGGEGDEREEFDKPAEEQEAAPAGVEDEFARKQRIAARIAGMGGQRFGMIPGMGPPARAPVHREEEEDSEEAKSPPPRRSAPVPRPPPTPPHHEDHEDESDYQHVSDSERVAHEESELEEVTYTDVEEEAPRPAVPDRRARRVSTGPPPIPQARPLSPPSLASPPPVPRGRPPQPPAFTYPPPPPSRPTPTTRETQGDFVIVDQGQSTEEFAPPPPSRAARPPPRGAPLPPPPAPEASDLQSEQPVIPDVDFGGETDLSLSAQWSEDSTNYPPAPPGRPSAAAPPVPLQQQTSSVPATQPPAEQHLVPEELMGHWGRVGVQIHEVAAALFERSKKGVIGDGSYIGFVTAVLGQVPNAAQPAQPFKSFGYLVYSQTAAAVQRRVSDIMPGDVLVAHDAKFKGHKGLQSYHQNVGVGQPLVAVIGDFETKKSKVRVFQANQHVGQQSVESASYRLEDLKSGSVKIFRVLEA